MTSDQAIGISSFLVSIILGLFAFLLGHRNKTVTELERLQREVATLQAKLELCEEAKKAAIANQIDMYQILLNAKKRQL